MNKQDEFVRVERLTVSLESELVKAIREAVNAESLSVSAWISKAACRQLADSGLREVVSRWESEHGSFTNEKLKEARDRLRG